MATKYTLRNGTAYPKERIKTVLIEEVMRRLRNCSPELTWKEKGKFLTEYAREMKNSGHSEEFRIEVIHRAVEKYKKILNAHLNGEKQMYRSKEERNAEIAAKGGKARKDSWFRKKRQNNTDERKITSVLRVPYTRGKMKKMIDRTLETSSRPDGTHAIAHEDSGDKLLHQLVRPDPFPADSCGRQQCRTVKKTIDGKCENTCWQQHTNYTKF